MSSFPEKNYQTMSTSLPTASSSTKIPKFNFNVFSGLLANIINNIPFPLYNGNKNISDSNMSSLSHSHSHSAPNIYLDIITNKLEFPNNEKAGEGNAILKDTNQTKGELNLNYEKMDNDLLGKRNEMTTICYKNLSKIKIKISSL